MLVRKVQHDRVGRQFISIDGVLRNDAILILDFHRHIFVGKERTSLLEDGGHLSCFDPMFVIFTDPYLQLASRALAKLAAAVDECLMNEAHFSDVKGNRHWRSIRQGQAKMPFRVIGQKGFEFGKIHGLWVFLAVFASFTGPGQQLPSRLAMRASARLRSAARKLLPEKFFITAFNKGK